MALIRLREFLDSHNVKYVVISHSVAYTAQGVAALTHIPGEQLANHCEDRWRVRNGCSSRFFAR